MDTHLQTFLYVLLTILLVLLNGFFVATEFAIVKVRSTRIKELADGGSAAAKHAADAVGHLDAYLSATQLGITLASLGLGWVGEPVVAHRLMEPFFGWLGQFVPAFAHIPHSVIATISYVIAFSLITFMHIVFGELAPKSLAIQRAESTALWVAHPMRAFYALFKLPIMALNGTANAVLRVFGIHPASASELVHSEEELRMIITASDTDHGGTIRETQAELLDNVFDFGHRMARQVMTHRTEVHILDAEDTLAECVRIAQEAGHTRFPVCEGDIDAIIGFVHTKDLYALYQREPEGDLRDLVRKALVVPETMRVDLLLRQMQRQRQHLAIVVDEYGGTAGMVTVADLLEELVGELPDEFELEEQDGVIALGRRAWSVDGRLPLGDLEEILEQDLPCEEACDTVGGYAFWAFGRIPEAGDMVERDGIRVRVLAMDGRRVSRVEINADPALEEMPPVAAAGSGRAR